MSEIGLSRLKRYLRAMVPKWFIRFKHLRALPGLLAVIGAFRLHGAAPVEFWLTTADLSQRLSPQAPLAFTVATARLEDRIEIEDGTTFQTMLGLGSSLEPTTCSNFWRMAAADREALVERVVDPEKGIGMNL